MLLKSLVEYKSIPLQAAAVSVCQYLASEVHKPLAQIPEEEEEDEEGGKEAETVVQVPKKKPASSSKKGSANTNTAPAPTSQPAAVQKPKPVVSAAPPTPVVAQLMEMGFERRTIEYAILTTSSNSPERLINWLVDHQGMEIPEIEPPSPPTPQASAVATPSEVPVVQEQRSASASSSGSAAVMYSESSIDSSDSSSEEAEAEEPESKIFPPKVPKIFFGKIFFSFFDFFSLIYVVGPEKIYKTREDFSTTDDYAKYVRDNLSVGIMVRCCEAYEEVRLGDVGRVMKVGAR